MSEISFYYYGYKVIYNSEELPQEGQRIISFIENDLKNEVEDFTYESYKNGQDIMYPLYRNGIIDHLKKYGKFPNSFRVIFKYSSKK